MIDENTITRYVYELADEFEALNVEFIEMIARHIKEIGTLTPTDIHRTEQMLKMSSNVNELKKKLAKLSGASVSYIDALYDNIIISQYADVEKLYLFRNGTQIPLNKNIQLLKMVQAIKNITTKQFENIAKTTVISDVYKRVVDKAILKVTEGVQDYKSAIRSELRKASSGMRVRYESGLTRRLDSAIRMNVLDGVRQVNQGIRQITGQQFGANGVEISAHALCAEDHLDIQGQQFTIAEFESLNNTLARPIGELNCRHTTTPIIIGISEPSYSQETLNEYRQMSTQKTELFGMEKTRYEWSQVCRSIETQIRYDKELFIMARESGDTDLMRSTKEHIQLTQSKYNNICYNTGLTPHLDRAYVPNYIRR